MPEIRIHGSDKVIQAEKGANLRKILLANKIKIYAFPDGFLNCRGVGICGTCLVKIAEAENVQPAAHTFFETEQALSRGEYRLSCQVTIEGDLTVRLNPMLPLAPPGLDRTQCLRACSKRNRKPVNYRHHRYCSIFLFNFLVSS